MRANISFSDLIEFTNFGEKAKKQKKEEKTLTSFILIKLRILMGHLNILYILMDPLFWKKVKITAGITGQSLLRVRIEIKNCYIDVESKFTFGRSSFRCRSVRPLKFYVI